MFQIMTKKGWKDIPIKNVIPAEKDSPPFIVSSPTKVKVGKEVLEFPTKRVAEFFTEMRNIRIQSMEFRGKKHNLSRAIIL